MSDWAVGVGVGAEGTAGAVVDTAEAATVAAVVDTTAVEVAVTTGVEVVVTPEAVSGAARDMEVIP